MIAIIIIDVIVIIIITISFIHVTPKNRVQLLLDRPSVRVNCICQWLRNWEGSGCRLDSRYCSDISLELKWKTTEKPLRE